MWNRRPRGPVSWQVLNFTSSDLLTGIVAKAMWMFKLIMHECKWHAQANKKKPTKKILETPYSLSCSSPLLATHPLSLSLSLFVYLFLSLSLTLTLTLSLSLSRSLSLSIDFSLSSSFSLHERSLFLWLRALSLLLRKCFVSPFVWELYLSLSLLLSVHFTLVIHVFLSALYSFHTFCFLSLSQCTLISLPLCPLPQVFSICLYPPPLFLSELCSFFSLSLSFNISALINLSFYTFLSEILYFSLFSFSQSLSALHAHSTISLCSIFCPLSAIYFSLSILLSVYICAFYSLFSLSMHSLCSQFLSLSLHLSPILWITFANHWNVGLEACAIKCTHTC